MFTYQVRPMNLNITYDLLKIKNDLEKQKILINKKTKKGFPYQEYNARKFYKFAISKLNKNPLYFLDKKTKKILIQKKILSNGRVKIQNYE